MSKFNNALKESEMRYLNLINSILDLLIEINLDFEITYINPQIYDLLGYSSKELIGEKFIDLIYPDDVSKIKEVIYKTIKKNGTISTELKIQHKKGYYIQFSAKGQVVDDDNRDRIVLLLRNITQIKETQQKLIESDKKYREIIENIEDGYFEVDLRGNYTYINDYACRFLGVPKEE
ncbi:MAG: PAS domain-containing protein, partial [Promethearchaeota archaeon]